MPVTVEKIETPTDDASLNASRTAYTADGGLSAGVSSVAVDVYLSSIDLKVTAKSALAARNIQLALKERGMEAQTEDDAKTHRLTVRNADAATGMAMLVTALGKLGERSGGISREVAYQILEMELASQRTAPSDWDMVKINTQKGRNGFAGRIKPASTAPSFYIKADIDYELSPVSYLEEDGNPATYGNEHFTRMGLRGTFEAKPVFEALKNAGIKADIISVGSDQVTHVNVWAPADKVSGALKEKGVILPSIDTEIQAAALKARLAAAQEQSKLRQATARAGH